MDSALTKRASSTIDSELTKRAKLVLPSLTHLNIQRLMASGYSQFYAHGKGCRVTDVDGKEYIDYMCSRVVAKG